MSTPAPHGFDVRKSSATLFGALLQAAKAHGADRLIIEDHERQPLSYKRLVLGSLILGAELTKYARRGGAIGLLLPTSNALAVTLFGLNAHGRVAAMLNFTAGLKNVGAAIRMGVIETVVTSRRFAATAKLEDLIAGIAATTADGGKPVQVLYLEDLRARIGIYGKARGLLRSNYAMRYHQSHALRPDQAAVILFTSGTEGTPKGVVLSNQNLVANAQQIRAHASGMLSSADTVFNPLPMFHSFGLTAATLMPLLSGMRTVLYPSPLHYKQVPDLIAKTKATVLFATDTFLQGYARAAGPGQLDSVRYVVAGAERVKDQTRAMWDKTGAVILEGYGATECAPVLACNLPDRNRAGTVGPLLPGIEFRLDPVDGITEGGRLLVRGPNVMMGYMQAERPGVIIPTPDGWHDTGDIIAIDEAGRIAIKGRAKRFAKLAGEMVSLAAVEALISEVWPESNHVVLAVPDPRRGEQLVLITDHPTPDRESIISAARANGVPELWIPRQIMAVAAIPLLGSGKVDFPAALQIARGAIAVA